MFTFIYGGSGSGKSAFAERRVTESGIGRRLYIATMEPGGPEAQARIRRHRKLREGKGFETVERFRALADLEVPAGCAALLEDLTNLLANEYFGAERENAAARVLNGLRRLNGKAALAVVVANDVFSSGERYDSETTAFLEELAALHRIAVREAEEVWEVVCGIPVRLK